MIMSNRLEFSSLEQEIRRCSVATKGNQSPRCFRSGTKRFSRLFSWPPIAGILAIWKQTSALHLFTINAGQTERQLKLNQNMSHRTENQLALPCNDRIANAAHKLALRFADDTELPSRFRRQTDSSIKPRAIKENSEIEVRFRANINSWACLIETMISKIDQVQAWRFIHLLPQIEPGITTLTENKDFCDLITYLVLRRDTELCDSDELGGLALLSVAFQREIERRIN